MSRRPPVPRKSRSTQQSRRASSSRVGRRNFNWSRLSKGAAHKDFEDMCLDLFGEEHGDIAFVPGPRRTGKDGGADGAYDGNLGRRRARWKLACTIRQKHDELRRKLDLERDKALIGGFTGLVFMTSVDLTTEQVAALQSRALKAVAVRGGPARKIKHAYVWGRSSLERLLKRHPWVAAIYFGHQLLPGFVPLAGSEGDLSDQPDLKLVGRRAELANVGAFLGASEMILVVVASGGSGKSRLLRAVSNLAREVRPRRSAWLRRPGIGTVEAGLRSGLPTSRPLLLALDDAGRALGDVHQLATVAADGKACGDVKVVLAARAADRDAVEGTLRAVPGATYKVLELAPLTAEQGTDVACLELPSLPRSDAARLAKHFGPNLFLLRAAAQHVRLGSSPASIVRSGRLRDLVAERLVGEATVQLGLPNDAARRLLLQVALDVPVRNDPSAVEYATLREAGLLRIVGSTLRFRADVEGDLLLGYLLAKPWARAALQNELLCKPELMGTRVRNLAAAGGDHPKQVIASIARSWLEGAAAAELKAARGILEILPWCTRAAPEIAVQLCEQYAGTQEKLTTDDFGPVAISLAHGGQAITSLRLLRKLHDIGVAEGQYSNYKFDGAVQESVSLRYLKTIDVDELVGELSNWLRQAISHGLVVVMKAALNGLLSGVVSWETSEGATTTFHKLELPDEPAVVRMRAAVFNVVAAMLEHADRRVRLAAAQVLHENVSAPGLEAARRGEFLSILPVLEKCLSTEDDLAVLDSLEKGLVFRWAGQCPGADKAEQILCATPWPSILRAFQLASKPSEFYLNISDAIAVAPTQDRWVWWVDHRPGGGSPGPLLADIEKLAQALGHEYPGTDGVLAVVRQLEHTAHPLTVLDAWCRRSADTFRDALALAQTDQQEKFLQRALRRLGFAQRTLDAVSETKRLAQAGVPLETVAEVLQDVGSISHESLFAIAEVFTMNARLDWRQFGLAQISRQGLSREQALAILEHALRDGLWIDGWDSISYLIGDDEGRQKLSERPSLGMLLEARIVQALASKEWSERATSSWHIVRSAETILGNDLRRQLDFLQSVASPHSLWREPVARILRSLVSSRDALGQLAQALCDILESKRANDSACAHFVGALVEAAKAWPPEAMTIALECVASEAPVVRRVGVVLLSEMRQDPHACVELAKLADGVSLIEQSARIALSNFTRPRGSWSGTTGEPYPAFVEIQARLKMASSLARTVAVRKRIAALQSDVEQSIRDQLRGDEEFLDPR